MIAARGLTKRFQDGERAVPVLDGVELRAEKGELVAVIGPSGSGKSTLLHVLGGLDVDYEGEVEIAGEKITGLSDRALSAVRNARLGFVFQAFHLVADLPALDNVLLPAFFAPGQEPTALRRRAEEVLERVGLADKRARIPAHLSGGERQRVAIARALLLRPSVLLCDEPTGNLDAATGEAITSLFTSLAQEGLTVLVATHEERLTRLAGRVLRLWGGKLSAVEANR